MFFLPDAEEVARELMTFPNGEYDDSIDALVYAVMGTKGRRSRDVLFIDTYI